MSLGQSQFNAMKLVIVTALAMQKGRNVICANHLFSTLVLRIPMSVKVTLLYDGVI